MIIIQALNNLIALCTEEKNTAATRIWSHPGMSAIFKLCEQSNAQLVSLVHTLLSSLIERNSDYVSFYACSRAAILWKYELVIGLHIYFKGLQLLEILTPQYFTGRIFSPQPRVAAEMCKFVRRLLESLTQVRAYQKAKEAAFKAYEKDTTKVKSIAPRKIHPPYKLGKINSRIRCTC